MERKIPASDARSEFATLINEVAFSKSRTILTRHGRDIAALIPIEDMEIIRRLEDQVDAKKIHDRKNEPLIPLARVMARLSLGQKPKKRSTKSK